MGEAGCPCAPASWLQLQQFETRAQSFTHVCCLQVDQLQGAHETLHGSVAAFRQASCAWHCSIAPLLPGQRQ